MDYEKAYKGALLRCKWQLANGLISKEVASDLFRELEESEDERIKDAIEIALSGETAEKCLNSRCVKLVDALAYLEKQKEQKPSTDETELNSIAFLERLGYTCIPPEKEEYEAFEDGNATGWRRKEQKPAEWSEEDEDNFSAICEIIKCSTTIPYINGVLALSDNYKRELLDFLKSLRPVKQEWSEEDKEMLRFWNMYYEHKVGDWSNKDVVEHLERFREWLNNRFKSLRPQPSWKPSEYTLSLVKKIADGEMLTCMEQMAMGTLYEQLKKL